MNFYDRIFVIQYPDIKKLIVNHVCLSQMGLNFLKLLFSYFNGFQVIVGFKNLLKLIYFILTD